MPARYWVNDLRRASPLVSDGFVLARRAGQLIFLGPVLVAELAVAGRFDEAPQLGLKQSVGVAFATSPTKGAHMS